MRSLVNIKDPVCNCYAIWHYESETEGCIHYIRKEIDSKSVEILQYLSYGFSYPVTAKFMGMSISMCEYYVNKAKRLLKTKNRVSTVSSAIRLGLIS